MKDTKYSLRALALLLGYPSPALRAKLPALIEAIEAEGVVPAARLLELKALASELNRMDAMESEARYVETFDRGHATSLHMFEHVHGDSRDRGPAMVDLAQTYEKAGLFLAPEEMPDHLCVVLEFASTQPANLAADFLGEMAHVLTSIFSALQKRESPYAAVVAAVLEIAGQKVQSVPVLADAPIDESWAEPEVFDGCSTQGQAKPGEAQPIHFVHKSGQKPVSGKSLGVNA